MATIAKTVGSFDKVLATCKQIGAQYQPNVDVLTPAALSQLQERAQASLRAASKAQIAYSLAVKHRKKSFESMPKLAVRIVRILSTFVKEDDVHLQSARAITKRFYSARRKQTSAEGADNTRDTRSSGRFTYDQQLETFTALIMLVVRVEAYNPAEDSLKREALKQVIADLRAKCHTVADAYAAMKRANLLLDEAVFGSNGIVKVSRSVKAYIQGAFGSFSNEASQLSSAQQL